MPVGAVYCAVTPRMFQQIRRLGVAESTALNPVVALVRLPNMQPMFGGVAAAGGLGEGFRSGLNAMDDKLVYMGVTIIKSNHLPTEDYAELDQNDDPVPVPPSATVVWFATAKVSVVSSGCRRLLLRSARPDSWLTPRTTSVVTPPSPSLR